MPHLVIEFPIRVLASYRGPGNLDETVDDNICWMLGQWFHDNEIPFTIQSLDWIDATPNQNEELLRFTVLIEDCDESTSTAGILEELQKHGFEKGLTVKNTAGTILHADDYTADLQERRRRQQT